ncbi:Peptidase S24/S26A/S26B, conserved region [Solidesulfovibrio carbinoliphilus subsp. oakridgensis]|uniref:Peptidase S24/S26A/S26B, conserved region n=1 Tax=Solidesulfovibrio carbinoliphilus subsp. oakridgensis TaxID=694327 RepID=G7QCA4_9BACT|nr:LexA family transcriptional regulator [Solidesulfovibrio carbinoliphilus]EHJ49550.1 Peptidase S24/S26A/S26B, conserved region [Solidesulfovibrio carbinoliphilus subsp. oakridgensis]
MPFLDEIQALLDRYRGNQSELVRLTGVPQSTLNRLFKGTGSPKADILAKILDAVGAKLVLPGERPETTRDVCWVDAKIVSAGDGQPLPPSENYFAVPLVGEAGAGPGVMSDDVIKSWVLVYRHQHAVRLKSNLLAVEIGQGSTSMEPLLHPGDIVLCDRDDFKPTKPGGIFLVREPGQHGGAKIKRVSIKPVDHDLLITFYSQDTVNSPPETFSLRGDYNDNITEAIIGRCVWAWQDITGK